MQFITAHGGKLQTLSAMESSFGAATPAFATGLAALDALAPQEQFARGAVHELLFRPCDGEPSFVAALIARAASEIFPLPPGEGRVRANKSNLQFALTPILSQRERDKNADQARPIIWSDPHRELYPPALASLGFDLSKLYLLRPQSPADESWAITECLRCRGVGAVVAAPQRISRIEARRFQLAAERGGGVGIFLRKAGKGDAIYAAASRWLVAPHSGERTIQRWTIQLLHGHGGRIGQTVFLEWCRETNTVRAVEKLADRSAAPATAEKRAIA